MTETASKTLTAPTGAPDTAEGRIEIASSWIASFHEAMETRDPSQISELFDENATFRELLALSWDFRNAVGVEEITALLTDPVLTPPLSLTLRPDSTPMPGREGERETIDAFAIFRTSEGSGNAYVQLAANEDGEWRAQACVLALEELDGVPVRTGRHRQVGRSHAPTFGRLGWQEQLDHEFERTDPAVVILGAGHNGLMLAARLQTMGIRALVVERNSRVGDNWRNRYSSLALHTPIAADHLPYVPFPETWTKYTPKDKLGDFLECYATLLDIPVWTGSTVENVQLDEHSQRWTVDIVRSDGTRRSLATAHLVFATGINGEPKIPDVPLQEDYRGTVLHAVQYQGYEQWVGKRAVVVGSGVSGHDIAQDLAEHGVDVTMIQRSGTIVMEAATFHTLMYPNHISGKFSIDDADIMAAAAPFGILPSRGASQLAAANAMDRELLDSLTKAGFKLSAGPDGEGVLGSIFREGATGYYYNAGASNLIADGTIRLQHGSVTGFTETGINLDDGTAIDADLVVFATGYRGATTAVRDLLGDELANELGAFHRVGEDREFGRLWRRTMVDRLWLMISLGIDNGRFYSKLLALQIAAVEAGIVPVTTD